MFPKLSEAYSLILEMERLSTTEFSNRDSIIEEINDQNKVIEKDILDFNRLVQESVDKKSQITFEEVKENLLLMRAIAMGLSTEFDNFVEDLDKAIQQENYKVSQSGRAKALPCRQALMVYESD